MLKNVNSFKLYIIFLIGVLLVNLFLILTMGILLNDFKKKNTNNSYSSTENFSNIFSHSIKKQIKSVELIINATKIQNTEDFDFSENLIKEDSKFNIFLKHITFSDSMRLVSIYLLCLIVCIIFCYIIYFFFQREFKKGNRKGNRLEYIIQSSREGMYGIDNNGNCTFCNSKALQLLGYSKKIEIVGKKIHEIIFSNEIYNDTEIDNFLLKSNTEMQIRRKDGTLFFAQFWQHPQIYENETTSHMITFEDISEKKEMDNLVWKKAHYDSLTGIPNRVFFEEKLKETIEQSENKNENFAVLFIDLDHFKDINDNLGHHAGDELLFQVADRLKCCVRPQDIVARLGGDEFTIILNNIKEKTHIEKVCQKIIEKIQKPFFIYNQSCNIGSSIGITYFPEDTVLLEDLLKNADKAMYFAKEKGRNCYNFFNKELDSIFQRKIEISNELKDAINNNELQLYIQPIVDTKTTKIIKAEILLRWKHPLKGFISPDEFIPLSEKNGMIHPIGQWVFKNSTIWLNKFLQNNPKLENFKLSINISHLQFII